MQAFPDIPVDSRQARHTLASYAETVSRFRKKRRIYFSAPESVFADPAWDMIIGLFVAAMKDQIVTVTGACLYAEVPVTTALRYLRILHASGIIDIECAGYDRRVREVSLTAEAVDSMIKFLRTVDTTMRGHPMPALVG